jgi:hypothetical protein
MGLSLIDRLLLPVRPGPIASFTPPPQELAPGLWRLDRRLRMPGGLVLPVATTIFRLPSGKLFLHAPVTLDLAAEQSLRALGSPSVLLAPNAFHHLFIGAYRNAFADSTAFYAPGLPARVPGLPPGVEVDERGPDAWEGAVEPVLFGPMGMFSEIVVFHPATATLVLTDLAFNIRRYRGTFDRIGWRLFGVPPEFGTSRTARLTLLRDKGAARPFVEKMLAKDFRRILVAHGEPVEHDAKSEFARAFRRYLEA